MSTAQRIARLLGPIDPEWARNATTDTTGRCWMPQDVLDALREQAGAR